MHCESEPLEVTPSLVDDCCFSEAAATEQTKYCRAQRRLYTRHLPREGAACGSKSMHRDVERHLLLQRAEDLLSVNCCGTGDKETILNLNLCG